MALSFGLIIGFDPRALFFAFFSGRYADLAGTITLFSLTVLFMAGLHLRIISLALALFVLCSSLAQNYLLSDYNSLSGFWRDLSLVCGVLLSYSSLRRRDLRKAAVLGRHRIARRPRYGQGIVPRRVSTSAIGEHSTRWVMDMPMLRTAPSDLTKLSTPLDDTDAPTHQAKKNAGSTMPRSPLFHPPTPHALTDLWDDWDESEDPEYKNIFSSF